MVENSEDIEISWLNLKRAILQTARECLGPQIRWNPYRLEIWNAELKENIEKNKNSIRNTLLQTV
jgi:hypothetical protein